MQATRFRAQGPGHHPHPGRRKPHLEVLGVVHAGFGGYSITKCSNKTPGFSPRTQTAPPQDIVQAGFRGYNTKNKFQQNPEFHPPNPASPTWYSWALSTRGRVKQLLWFRYRNFWAGTKAQAARSSLLAPSHICKPVGFQGRGSVDKQAGRDVNGLRCKQGAMAQGMVVAQASVVLAEGACIVPLHAHACCLGAEVG